MPVKTNLMSRMGRETCPYYALCNKLHKIYNWDIFFKGYNVYKDRTDGCIRRFVKMIGG